MVLPDSQKDGKKNKKKQADYLNFRHYIPTYLLQNFFHAKWVGVGFQVQKMGE